MTAGDATERVAKILGWRDRHPNESDNEHRRAFGPVWRQAEEIVAALCPPGQVLDGDDGQVKAKVRLTSWLHKAAPDGSDWCWHSASDSCTVRDHVTTPLYALRPLPDTREGDE